MLLKKILIKVLKMSKIINDYDFESDDFVFYIAVLGMMSTIVSLIILLA